MKKDWKKKLKRMGAAFLLAALLIQSVGSHVYAAETGTIVTENPASMEAQEPAEETNAAGDTRNVEETSEPEILEEPSGEQEKSEDAEDSDLETSERDETESGEIEEKKTYSLSVVSNEGGHIELSSDSAENGDTVEFQIFPEEDYAVASVFVIAGESEIGYEAGIDKKEAYSFEMPEADVEIQVVFAKEKDDLDLNDADAIIAWFEQKCDGSYEILAEKESDWWDGLSQNEKIAAGWFASFIVEGDSDPNHYTFETLDEVIKTLEDGIEPEEFFAGTRFEPLQLEDLYLLRDHGWTLDDLGEFAESMYQPDVWSCELLDMYYACLEGRQELSREEWEALEVLHDMAEMILPMDYWGIMPFYFTPQVGDEYAVMRVSSTGIGTNGGSGFFADHGTIFRLTIGGVGAFCLDYGKSARNGYIYGFSGGDVSGRIVYIAKTYASASGPLYAAAQMAIWSIQRGLTPAAAGAAAYENVKGTVQDITATFIKNRVIAIMNESVGKDGGTVRLLQGPAGSQTGVAQEEPPMLPYDPNGPGPTPPGEGAEPEFASFEDSITVTYSVNVNKSDWQTNVGLKGCTIDIYENGSKVASVTTDANGNASWSTSKSTSASADYCVNYSELTPVQQAGITGCKSLDEAVAQVNAELEAFAAIRYTYRIREVTAPKGYVWAANEGSKSIAGNETASFSITNERTLGSVELVKYDTESESDIFQGDATLQGAVYGIYAKTDIIHQDTKSGVVNRDGVIWKKDALIQTQTIGRSPKCDGNGYMLNTDGTRHIANPGGTIAYEDTPGKTRFADLELGEYYIREITPSEGYMLDETSYDVTFTYKDQMVKVEVRDETAGDADNELTADDGSASKTVYSGDYVIKQGIQFLKTSDNTYQTELAPIEGAGFSIYLISGLSGVQDGSILPLNGTWGSDDIMTFYDYDFTQETRAVLYKRTDHETWTEGDKKWLVNLGGNQYQTAEMFTDGDGRIETPELPYGTYVIVETTTPEHHVMAKPFIVYITQDGGVLYTDAAKQKAEKTYTPEEGIRYGDHKDTKDREGRILQKQRIINNTITQTFLRVVKADEEFLVQPGAYISAEEMVRGTVLKEGARYRVRCRTLELSEESLKALNWKYDSAGYLSYYAPNTKELTGTAEHPFTTSFLRSGGKILDCYITLPQELPIGTYELEELTAPEGYVVNGSEQAVRDTSAGRVNGYEIVDAPREKAVFTINNGSVYPDGQMGTNKYALQDAYGNLTVTVLQKNQEQKGILEVYKHGEQVSGVKKGSVTLLDKLKGEPFRYLKLEDVSGEADLIFSYEDAPVEGARFQVIAEEDIYTQELDKALFDQYQVNVEDYRIYRKGEVVATITTDRNGWGYASGLYIGKYKLVETVAGTGFVLNTKETFFEITPKEQTVNFDFHSADYENQRQKLEISVTKKDAESGKALAGAVYGLYAAEDLYTNIEYSGEAGKWVVRDTPEILAGKDALVASCITDENGTASFDADLPLGRYYVRELEAPLGYLNAPEDIFLDAGYTGEQGGQYIEVQRHQAAFGNIQTTARISKQDLAGRKELPGASLELYEIGVDGQGELLKKGDTYVMAKKDEWISGKTPYEIRGLQLGRTYLLRERKPADGYVTAEDMLFRLVQERDEDGKLLEISGMYVLDGETWKRCEEDLLVMLDDVTKLQISKKDITTGEELPGAFLELYDENEEFLEDWISEEEPHYIEKLPIGKYKLVEYMAPDGYGYAEDVVFEVKDTGEIQTVEMLDDVQKIQVEKSTISMTQTGDVYKNTVDCVRNHTEVTLDHFTLTDSLPEQVWLTELWTGTYNQDLTYQVEYKTNRNGDWILWEEDLDTRTNHHLTVPEALDGKAEHITSFRILYGTVEGKFENEICPAYLVKVDPSAMGGMLNRIELTAEQDGTPLKDRAETITRMFFRMMMGYAPQGMAVPAYEIVNTAEPEKEEIIEEKVEYVRRNREMTTEMPVMQTTKGGLESPPTGDPARPLAWLSLLAVSIAGLCECWIRQRKRKKKPETGKN